MDYRPNALPLHPAREIWFLIAPLTLKSGEPDFSPPILEHRGSLEGLGGTGGKMTHTA